MKILITGGTGKIGQEICKNLAKNGHDPVCFSRKKRGSFPVITGDIRVKKDIKKAIKNFDCIIHAAAIKKDKNKRDIISTNIEGTINLINFCKKNTKIKIISTTEACNTTECYGASKFIIEELSKEYDNISFLRLPSVWGTEVDLTTNWLNSARITGKIKLFKFNGLAKKKFFITLKDAGVICSNLSNFKKEIYNEIKVIDFKIPINFKKEIYNEIKVIDCEILANCIKQITKCHIEEIEKQGSPFEYFSSNICSSSIESISIEETKKILSGIYKI